MEGGRGSVQYEREGGGVRAAGGRWHASLRSSLCDSVCWVSVFGDLVASFLFLEGTT